MRSPLLIFILLLSACAQLPTRPALPTETSIPPAGQSQTDLSIAQAEQLHPGQSAFRLLSEGPEAFALRARSAQLAVRSLDVQTYIWHGDLTGLHLAHELLQAADRGVRVRLLVDDMDARAKNLGFVAIDAHPNISVRMFNPFASRSGTLAFMAEGMRSFGRINHRMHNKSWIADNRIAIVGGRNLGDEYFGASEHVNFIDLDFAMFGPVVRDVSASFDRYWNSPAAYPIELLDPAAVETRSLDALRVKLQQQADLALASKYADVLRQSDAVARMVGGDWPVQWSGQYSFVADDPLKATMQDRDPQRSQVMQVLVPAMRDVRTDLTIVSPYFVPGKQGTQGLVETAGSGRRVRILTNSLEANDVAAVHGGYSRHRKELLAGGVQLWELKPLRGEQETRGMFGSSGASLHTKGLLLDARSVFVGSYNLDPRSTWLNCEQGVLVENEQLAAQMETLFAAQISGAHAWHVQLEGDQLKWSDGAQTYSKDPDASFSRRFQAWFARVLHLDAQL